MKQIIFDHLRLRTAIVLLLSQKYGEQRSKEVRERIKTQSKRGFYRQIEPLNEILKVAQQSALTALDLLDRADRAREKAKREAEYSSNKARLDVWRSNIARYRKRLREALKTEELRRQRKLTKEEAEAFLNERKELWRKKQELFISEHPELKRQEATKQFAEQLDKEVSERYQRALASGPVKKTTTVAASKSKLDELQRKFRK